ncbi:MAG: 3'-phosphoesterase [Candidatus Aenigmarchaeota archaeon]|nr:3'-phosphoesterase [Candidatus Aenigmarchaeota archaeon]
MAVEDYRGRGSPKASGKGAGPKEGARSIFVVQEHLASRHHWDLRLEIGGVLRSWAMPKEPPLAPGIRRLAIQTNDHPLEYADFEGNIPEGEYGAGRVKRWDGGTYEFESVHDNKYVCIMKGDRLKGAYVLLRFRPGKEKGMWLFFRRK